MIHESGKTRCGHVNKPAPTIATSLITEVVLVDLVGELDTQSSLFEPGPVVRDSVLGLPGF